LLIAAEQIISLQRNRSSVKLGVFRTKNKAAEITLIGFRCVFNFKRIEAGKYFGFSESFLKYF
jgi:hypothetical protein